jgi:hypothetical protein
VRRPQTVLCAIALAATLLACAPVVFLGKSLLSPELHGVELFYDRCPRLPGYTDCSIENVRGADLGAMMWQHFPLSVAQERSIKEYAEFPLWTRYNSAGTTLLGQGQMMLGDPLQWLSWLVGVDAWVFDARFVLLRAAFAAALGIAVFTVTRAFLPAALVAFAAPFIGYFIYRVSHPAIFTLCYSPLILLAWLKLIYGEERRRLAWVLALMLANWLVLNSGTAKEAYMAIIVLNALGAAHAVIERARFGDRFRAYSLLIAASGICFLMIALPVWGSLFDAIRHGTTLYAQQPMVQQHRPGLLIGFADNLYFLLSFGTYYPAVNPLLFAGLAGGVLCALRNGDPRLRRAAMVLGTACLGLIALAFSAVPAGWLLQIPFVRNITHIHNTFSTILVVPACVLAGIGFAHLAAPAGPMQRRTATVVLAFAWIALLAAYLDEAWPPFLPDALLYSSVVVGCALLVPELVYRLAQRMLSPAGIAAGAVVIALLIGRGAMYPDDVFDRAVLNPTARVSLVARPELAERLAPALAAEPARVLGLREVLFPGYNATLGLEGINGPDAIWNARYRELGESLELPFTKTQNWRMRFLDQHLTTHARALDFLGVGVVLTSRPLAPDAGLQSLGGDTRVSAFSRPGAWPRAFYAGSVSLHDGAQAVAGRVASGDGKPFVALERAGADADPALRRLLDKPAGAIVKARDYALTNNTTSFTIDAPAAGVVYLGETDEPGDFRVTVNGTPAAYLSANYAFKAVVVDRPGTYRITFRYWPAHLSLYLALAAVGLACWLAILVVFAQRRSAKLQ